MKSTLNGGTKYKLLRAFNITDINVYKANYITKGKSSRKTQNHITSEKVP